MQTKKVSKADNASKVNRPRFVVFEWKEEGSPRHSALRVQRKSESSWRAILVSSCLRGVSYSPAPSSAILRIENYLSTT